MNNALLVMLLSLRIISAPVALGHMATEMGVSAELAACVVTWESSWKTDEVSTSNAIGLFQIKPESAAWAAGKLGIAEYDLFDAADNMILGLYILKEYPEWYLVLDWCN